MNAPLLEELLKDIFNLDFRVRLMGIIAQPDTPLLPLTDNGEIALFQFLRSAVNCPLSPIVLQQILPQAGGGLVGVDVYQGTIEVKYTVGPFHWVSSLR